MSYIESNLQPGEQIQYKAKLHIILFLRPFALLLLGWWLYSAESGIIYYIGIFLLFVGAVSLIERAIIKIGSLYVVTNKRVILKTGILSRNAVELVLAKCEGLHIKQNVLGRIFNYGTITVTTGGVTSSYTYIADPLAFRREINIQIG